MATITDSQLSGLDRRQEASRNMTSQTHTTEQVASALRNHLRVIDDDIAFHRQINEPLGQAQLMDTYYEFCEQAVHWFLIIGHNGLVLNIPLVEALEKKGHDVCYLAQRQLLVFSLSTGSFQIPVDGFMAVVSSQPH